ncbi:MAG TPA: galactosamine-6-phosphate isomerase [Planctomycetes bacterium]|nr:galactosamine-6-phosphate isomerase [Planctomycetota bacterium]
MNANTRCGKSVRRAPARPAKCRQLCVLHVCESYEGMSRAAADHVIARVREKPDALLCVTAGATPERLYALLVEKHRAAPSLFARARFVQLYEWGGLAHRDRATSGAYLRSRLITPLGVGARRFLSWDSRAKDPASECRRVAAWLKAQGPIDACILGIGRNGHLGLNEPGDGLETGAHVTELSPASLGHSMLRESRSEVQYGLTLGMADILQAREVVLLASGAEKAAQMRRAFLGAVTTRCPASLLRLHPALQVFCDRAAAGMGNEGALKE